MSVELIKELTEIKALSGHEQPVKEYLIDKLAPNVDTIKYDNLGGFVAKVSGKKPGKNIAVIAHMDEVGMLVKQITKNGFIKVNNIGGLVVESLICQHVELINRDNEVFSGSVLCVEPHNAKGDKVVLGDLHLDLGFTSDKDVMAHNIYPGDQIIMKSEFTKLANDKIMAKALDNRLGCAAIVELVEYFKDNLEYGNLYVGATVQEEVGLRGANVITKLFDEKIDAILVVDVSPVDDTINRDGCKVSEGTLIRVRDPRMVLDYNEVGLLQELSRKYEIKAQNFFSNGGTDAAGIQIQGLGYITAALCVPGRNLHTNNSIVDYKDYQATVELAKKYIVAKNKK